MKKILLTFAAMLSFSATTLAQSIAIIPDANADELQGIGLSRDGRFVCGSTYNYDGFIANWTTGEVKVLAAEDLVYGCELRSVSNTGVATGFDGPAITVDLAGNKTKLTEDESIGECITSDGTLVVGSMTSETYYTHACYWKDGVLTMLPEPTSEEIGFEVSGSSAKYVSADGSVIVGQVIDNMASYPAIVWTLGEDGTYTLNLLSKGMFTDDWDDYETPYVTFTATGVSSNGRYIALTLQTNATSADAWDYRSTIGRYDLQEGTIEEAETDGSSEYSSCGIADDGTVVGYGGGWMERVGFIWKPGSSTMVTLSSEYPTITKLASYDSILSNTVIGISADGNYIMGFGMDPETYVYETYVLDRNLATGISSAAADAKEVKEVARYTIDGAKISTPSKGLNIVKMSDGTTKKVIVK